MAYKNFSNYNAFVIEATIEADDNMHFHVTYRELYNMIREGLPVFFTYTGTIPDTSKFSGVYYPLQVILPDASEDPATVDFINASTSGLIDSEIVLEAS